MKLYICKRDAPQKVRYCHAHSLAEAQTLFDTVERVFEASKDEQAAFVRLMNSPNMLYPQ